MELTSIVHFENVSKEQRERNRTKLKAFYKKEKVSKKASEKTKGKGTCCAIDASAKNDCLLFDSAASVQYTFSKAWYQEEHTPLAESIEVQACDWGSVHATQVGVTHLDKPVTIDAGEDGICGLTMKVVYFGPETKYDRSPVLGKRWSQSTLFQSFRTSKDRFVVTGDDNDTIMEAALVNKVFKLSLSESDNSRAREIAIAMSAKLYLTSRPRNSMRPWSKPISTSTQYKNSDVLEQETRRWFLPLHRANLFPAKVLRNM